MRLLRLAFLAVITFPITGSPQSARKSILPISPNELIKYLPAAPTEWKMTESSGKSFFMSWICAQATREFQHPPPPPPQPSATTPPPFITRVRLMDTGYYPSFNGDFENFKVGKYSNAESLLISGMPARKITISQTRERLRVSVRGRFIIEIETDNQPAGSGQQWLSLVDFRRINGIPDSAPSALPKPIVVENVDELHPSNNSTSRIMWGGPTSTSD
jgi:hypothetical protein